MIKDEILQEVREVELIGSEVEKLGDHTVYLDGCIVTFKNGLAIVGARVEEELRKIGVIK